MITLHGIWLPDAFFLFGRLGQLYTDVTDWIDQLELGENAHLLDRGKVGLRSFQLPYISKEDQQTKKPGLLLQNIKGVSLDCRDAFILLQSIDAHAQHNEICLAGDFLYWQKATHFVLELMIRGRYSPAVEITKKGHSYGKSEAIAKWLPNFEVEMDQRRFQLLAHAMPPVCRSYDPIREKGWVDIEPQEILLSFIREALNTLLQEWTDQKKFYEDVPSIRGNVPVAMDWLKALLGKADARIIAAKTTDLLKITTEINDWVQRKGQKKADNATYPLRLFFRLEPPEHAGGEQEGMWSLKFFLQSLDDPSILLSASELWAPKEKDAPIPYPFKNKHEVVEMLLVQLVKAAKLYPPLQKELLHPRPQEIVLDVKSAYDFLRVNAEQLQSEGFGIQLPTWWTQKGRKRFGIRVNVMKPRQSTFEREKESTLGLQQLLEFDAQVALGDELFSLDELKELAQAKVPLLQIHGEWTEIDTKELQQALSFVTNSPTRQIRFGDLLHLVAEQKSPEGLEDLPVVHFSLPKELSSLMEGQMEIHVSDRTVPDNLSGTLRPYQQRGFAWLATMTELGFGICLADDMGLGKTIQLITLLLAKPSNDPALVVCPTSLLTNWQREFTRFAPSLKIYVHHGSDRLHQEEFQRVANEHDVMISTYALISRDLEDFQPVQWSYLVADESQNIKNSNSKQAKSLMALQADHRIALTGTPVENRLSELWSLFQFLNPGYLGSMSQFRTSFALPIERAENQERAETLQKLVRPFVLRRVKKDPTILQELPEKIETKTFCTLTSEQASLYQATVDEMLRHIHVSDGMKRRGLVLASLTRLKQICNHPALFLQDNRYDHSRSGKLQRLLEIIEQIREQDEAVIIFTQYVEMGKILEKYLARQVGERPLFLHGGVRKQARDHMIDTFQSEDGPRIFILSLKAGGVGLNLTRANHVIHFDRWWNPAVENQATDRVFRIGQKKNVQVHTFICKGTLEERIDSLIESKRELAEKIIHSGEKWLTELSVGELTSLFSLRQDALESEEEEFV